MHELDSGSDTAPAGSAGTKGIWAGVAFLAAAIAFVVLAGCFLMGAFLLVMDPPPWMPPGTRIERGGNRFWVDTLSTILYIFAFGCGACAMGLLLLGSRTLLRATRS
jgi:hypothetical protein